MKNNGYPYFEDDETCKVTIQETPYEPAGKFVQSLNPLRQCCRCYKIISMGANGPIGACSYQTRAKDVITVHITKQMPVSLLYEFVKSEPPQGDQDMRSKEIYAIDCEMVYTVKGLALARLSVTDFDSVLVLDVIVKPPTKVLDANTRYSGLTLKQVNDAKDNLESCRLKLLKFINSETLLEGHSLECDLKALRLVHHNVVDTAVMYLRNGRKVSLRQLSSEVLGKQIQRNNSATFGHNSAEDAEAILSLMKHKIQQMML